MSIQKDDVGTRIKLDTGTDVSGAANSKIYYRKPGGTTGNWIASTSGDYLVYESTSGAIDAAGKWRLQGYTEVGTWSGRTSVADLTVEDNI
jgi:hypothetical protein